MSVCVSFRQLLYDDLHRYTVYAYIDIVTRREEEEKGEERTKNKRGERRER